jgi:hypothetical protein
MNFIHVFAANDFLSFDWIGTNEKIQLKVIYLLENNGNFLDRLSSRIQGHFLCQIFRSIASIL